MLTEVRTDDSAESAEAAEDAGRLPAFAVAKGCGASSLEDAGGSWLTGAGDTGASFEGA